MIGDSLEVAIKKQENPQIGGRIQEEIIECEDCQITFEKEDDLKVHLSKHRRKTRSFNYNMNVQKTKKKLLRGAKRINHLDIEVKSTCVNIRFSDGAYHEVVLPLLEDWYKQINKPFQLMGNNIEIVEYNTGVDLADKRMDTKLVVFVKGTLSPKYFFSYIKDISFINTVHRVKNSLMPCSDLTCPDLTFPDFNSPHLPDYHSNTP